MAKGVEETSIAAFDLLKSMTKDYRLARISDREEFCEQQRRSTSNLLRSSNSSYSQRPARRMNYLIPATSDSTSERIAEICAQ